MKFHLVAILITLGCLAAEPRAESPERKVEANVVISERDPKIRIHLPKTAQYVGADRWILYEIADCELHAFVEADANKNVRRLYWIQFEGYLPSKPELHHEYDSPRHVNISGLDFYVDAWAQPRGGGVKPGSDAEHIEKLVRDKGYKLPAGMTSVRFVHLLDEEMRWELMIIYAEDVSSTGFTAEELREGGKAHEQWPQIADALIERAVKKVFFD